MKNDNYFLKKMLDDIAFVIENMKDQTCDSLGSNPVLLDSMMFRLIQISESAKNLSEEAKQKYSEVPWTSIYGLRNRIVHDYGSVNLEIVYQVLRNDIIEVKKSIEGIKLDND